MEKKQHPVANNHSTPEKKKTLQKKISGKEKPAFFQDKINKKTLRV